jgi:hypothetical protein
LPCLKEKNLRKGAESRVGPKEFFRSSNKNDTEKKSLGALDGARARVEWERQGRHFSSQQRKASQITDTAAIIY